MAEMWQAIGRRWAIVPDIGGLVPVLLQRLFKGLLGIPELAHCGFANFRITFKFVVFGHKTSDSMGLTSYPEAGKASMEISI